MQGWIPLETSGNNTFPSLFWLLKAIAFIQWLMAPIPVFEDSDAASSSVWILLLSFCLLSLQEIFLKVKHFYKCIRIKQKFSVNDNKLDKKRQRIYYNAIDKYIWLFCWHKHLKKLESQLITWYKDILIRFLGTSYNF